MGCALSAVVLICAGIVTFKSGQRCEGGKRIIFEIQSGRLDGIKIKGCLLAMRTGTAEENWGDTALTDAGGHCVLRDSLKID